MHLYFIFTDLKNYSKLSEEQTIEFQQTICAELATTLSEFISPKSHVAFNTWGDAVYAVFEYGEQAVEFATTYRNFFKGRKLGNTKLEPRIAGHFGSAFAFQNPLIPGRKEVSGKHVNTTARIEPVTRPGEIYVSEAFKNAYESISKQSALAVTFEALGVLELAKGHDDELVFRLTEKDAKSHVIDKLMRADLSDVIPTMPAMSDAEEKIERTIKNLTSPSLFKDKLRKIKYGKCGAVLLLKLAGKAKSLGLYKLCLELLDQADDVDIRVNDERVYAVRHLPEFKKLKANALTRLGKYKKAEDIMFGLWHSGHQDSDTLSMLAAQYKRRGIFGKSRKENFEQIDSEKVDGSLLLRACKLYVEAFRKNISDYYPAINAAYLYLIIGGKEKGKGKKLAQHIVNSWEMPSEPNWFLAATLAEAEMLAGESEEALKLFKIAVEEHQPTVFQLQSTTEQVRLYSKLTSSEEELSDILDYLQEQLQMMAI